MSGLEEGLVNKGINAKFSIGLPDFVTSTKEIKDKISGSKEQVVTDSNGNTYKVKTDIDELDSKVLEASKNKGNNSSNTGNISNNKGVGRVDTLGEKLTLAPNDG